MIRHDYQRRKPRRPAYRAAVEALESRQVLTSLLGLTAAGELASFDSARPDQIRSVTAITGLQTGESLLGIDTRPATGQVYGLGSTGRLYTLDPATGASLLVGSGPLAATLSGTEYDLDFNPVADRLRIVSDGGLDLRVNPNTAEVTVDGNLAYAPTDPGAGTTPAILGAAYTNSVPGATTTTLFEIDGKRGVLVTQGSVGGAPVSPNSGQLLSVATLGASVSAPLGFEIAPDGQALVSQTPAGATATALYTLNLASGAVTLVGAFPGSITIRDITSAPRAETVFALTAGNRLISFRSNTPGTLLSDQAILGLRAGETIQSLDFRPATGQLFGFGSTGRFYVINPGTGNASLVSDTPISPAATGTKPSIDFNPTVDRIRFVTNAGQDLRINPDTGAVVAIDPQLAFAPGDPGIAVPPTIIAEGYTNNFLGSTSTTLYGIDAIRNILVTQGSVGGTPVSANSGQIFTVGDLGRNVTDDGGLDIAASGQALAALTDEGGTTTGLYIVNLTSGALTRIGDIGGGALIRDVAVAPAGFAQFSSATFTTPNTGGAATIVVTRIGGTSGPVQVRYATSDGTARAGVDYTAASGVLDFGDGETVKTFTVPIIAGAFTSGSRTVGLSLTSDAAGSVIGPIGTAVLTIQASGPVVNPGLQTATFRGNALAINSVDLAFNTPVDPVRARDVANYLVRGVSAGRPTRIVQLAVSSVSYDPATGIARLNFSNPFALRDFRNLQVSARGFGPDGFDATANYAVQRGAVVRYLDADGDRVQLRLLGARGSRLVVLQRVNETATYAWVEGRGRFVFGSLARVRGSDRRAVIDRFVTNGARLRLPRSIVVTSAVTSD